MKNIRFKAVFLCVITLYLLVSLILYLLLLRKITAFIPISYHITHATLIGLIIIAVSYKEIIAGVNVNIFSAIILIMASICLAFINTEGILKFSTLFLHKKNASLECVQVTGTAYRTKKHISHDALVKISNYWGITPVYPITQEEKSFIDKNIDSCVCVELSFYESPLGFTYTEYGKNKGVIKVCDEKK
ncbi:hypothetical protein ACE193_07125 [Bernardetia sp. OM2101]|uniref:hypothetical protein n=1 Tax=Bernardetia sp. OM2101 TaxID=3344876 RepID=UPI0035CFDEB7